VFVRRGLISKGKEIQERLDEILFTIDEIRVVSRKRDARWVRRARGSTALRSRFPPKVGATSN